MKVSIDTLIGLTDSAELQQKLQLENLLQDAKNEGAPGFEVWSSSGKGATAWDIERAKELERKRKNVMVEFFDAQSGQFAYRDKTEQEINMDIMVRKKSEADWATANWEKSTNWVETTNMVGKGTQQVMSFVPGVGTATGIALDGLRGGAESYSAAMEKSQSFSTAATEGLKGALSSSVASGVSSLVGLGNKVQKNLKNAGKYGAFAVSKTKRAITGAVKQFGKAISNKAKDEALKTATQATVDSFTASKAAPNTAPAPAYKSRGNVTSNR